MSPAAAAPWAVHRLGRAPQLGMPPVPGPGQGRVRDPCSFPLPPCPCTNSRAAGLPAARFRPGGGRGVFCSLPGASSSSQGCMEQRKHRRDLSRQLHGLLSSAQPRVGAGGRARGRFLEQSDPQGGWKPPQHLSSRHSPQPSRPQRRRAPWAALGRPRGCSPTCSRQGRRAGSSTRAGKLFCIQSFYSIKISGSYSVARPPYCPGKGQTEAPRAPKAAPATGGWLAGPLHIPGTEQPPFGEKTPTRGTARCPGCGVERPTSALSKNCLLIPKRLCFPWVTKPSRVVL